MVREHEKAVAAVEARIEELESRQAELTKQLEDPASYADAARAIQINRELMGVQQDLEEATAQWEAAAEALAALADTAAAEGA
jgi:ATP-binding cassette subfamily F protein 3